MRYLHSTWKVPALNLKTSLENLKSSQIFNCYKESSFLRRTKLNLIRYSGRQALSHLFSHSFIHSFIHSFSQSVSQSVSQAVSQPASQPASQSTNEWMNELMKWIESRQSWFCRMTWSYICQDYLYLLYLYDLKPPLANPKYFAEVK